MIRQSTYERRVETSRRRIAAVDEKIARLQDHIEDLREQRVVLVNELVHRESAPTVPDPADPNKVDVEEQVEVDLVDA